MLDKILEIVAIAVSAVVVFGVAGVIYDAIKERITSDAIRKHFGTKIKARLEDGDCTVVNFGLTTKGHITDISERNGETRVTYKVNDKLYGVSSRKGTNLSKNEGVTLTY